MIDFRYHLVSLISVFLALAIGIVLGAGPLKEAIGDQLTGQVEALRADKEQLRASLTRTENSLENRDAFLDAVSGQLLADTLPGRRVALIDLEDAGNKTLDQLDGTITAAGANVVTRVRLDPSWTSESKATFRKSLASSLVTYLEPESDNSGPDADLAAALVQSLTAVSPEDENALSGPAADLRSLLAASDLVVYEDESPAPADMIVLVSNPGVEDEETATDGANTRAQVVQVLTRLVLSAQARSESAVVVSVAATGDDLLARVGSDKEFKHVSTVARGDELPGQLNVPLALAASASGKVGRFGPQDGSTGVVPDIIRLGPVDRSARMATADVEDAAGSEDDEG